MLNWPFLPAVELAAEIKAKKTGCREALERVWHRVEHINPDLNAIVATDIDSARLRATEADRAIAGGESWGPLHGIPMTVKESLDVAGMPTTWGLEPLRGNIATANAAAVDRLIGAGAIIFGKTNISAGLADWQSYNSIYGTTSNPWDLARTPGGSSGGSAAALAAGLTTLEVGSDIGGSIRQPAHCCGIYGHKPTPGLVPLRGQFVPGNVAPVDLNSSGPMARSVADLEVALSVMAGPDGPEASAWKLDLPPPAGEQLSAFKVALLTEHPDTYVDRDIVDQLGKLASFLVDQGSILSDTARPGVDLADAHATYVRLLRSATSRRQSPVEFERNVHLARALPEGRDDYYARMVRAQTMRHIDWLRTDEDRHKIRRKWYSFFEDFDILLCPAAMVPAAPHDHVGELYERTVQVNGRDVPATAQFFWSGLATLGHLPATVAPIGVTAAGLPVGVQIIAAPYADRTCLAFAALLERHYHAFTPPPAFDWCRM